MIHLRHILLVYPCRGTITSVVAIYGRSNNQMYQRDTQEGVMCLPCVQCSVWRVPQPFDPRYQTSWIHVNNPVPDKIVSRPHAQGADLREARGRGGGGGGYTFCAPSPLGHGSYRWFIFSRTAVIYGLVRLAVVSYHSYVQIAVVQFNFLSAGFVPRLEYFGNVPRS